MAQAGGSLGRTAARGAAWLMIQSAGGRALAFFSQLALAAVLAPADFGLIGLAYTVSTFGSIVANSGVEGVVVQRHKTMRFWLVPAFWYSLGLGCLGLLIVLVLGPVFAYFYRAPQVVSLSLIVGVSIPLTSLSTVPNLVMRAGLQFRTIAVFGMVETLLIQGLTIAFAFAGFEAFAFALPLPIVAALRTVAAWLWTRPKLHGLFSKIDRIRYVVGNSLFAFATGAVQAAVNQGDYVVLGLLADKAAVGLYFFAFKMASQPLLLMVMSLGNVLFPALSHMRNNPTAQGEAAFRAAKLLGLLIMPLAFMQAGLIKPAMHLFFASKWDDSIPLMQILSVALGLDAISWIAATLLSAQRAFGRQFSYLLICTPMFFVLVAIGGYLGSALGVALGVAAYYGTVTPLFSYAVFRRSGVSAIQLLMIYLRPGIAAAVSVGIALGVTDALGVGNHMLELALISSITAACYTAAIRLIDPDGFHDVVEMATKVMARRATPAPNLVES